MYIKGVEFESFCNYYKPSMFIAFPNCSFKCNKECGQQVCQNCALAAAPSVDADVLDLIAAYNRNNITESVVCSGLDPMDSWDDLIDFIRKFRYATQDDVVIYTGYKEEEIADKIEILKEIPNIVIKFGRYIPDRPKRYDTILGVTLASDNQYARRIS